MNFHTTAAPVRSFPRVSINNPPAMMMMQRQMMPRRCGGIAAAPARRSAVLVRADKALIVNTKGGGHAFIGYFLAKKLKSKGHT